MQIPQERWNTLIEHFSHVTDGLGKPIDPEILETVVALNALAIPTVMSCGGHIDDGRGLLLPWVDIAPGDPALVELLEEESSLVKKAHQAHQEVLSLREQGVAEEQLEAAQRKANALYKRLHEVQWHIRVIQTALRQKLARYLAQFYDGRHVPFDRRLILTGSARTRLQSQGALDLYLTAPEEVQRQKLQEYRQEMAEFASFLKQLYFSQQALD